MKLPSESAISRSSIKENLTGEIKTPVFLNYLFDIKNDAMIIMNYDLVAQREAAAAYEAFAGHPTPLPRTTT